MTSFRAMSTVSFFGLIVALAGCSGESGTSSNTEPSDTAAAQGGAALEQPSSEASGVEAPRAAKQRAERGPGRHHQRGGPDFLLRAALHEPINLTAEQKATIEAVILANKPAGRPSFDKTRSSALAAGIRAGKDVSTLQAPNEERMAAHQAASAKALATLHATLTPEQRRALVDAVASRASEHGPKERGKDGARPSHMNHGNGPHPGALGPMRGMLEGLKLTTAQEQAIQAKLEAARPSEAAREAMKAEHEASRTAFSAKLQTFANDSFDATAFVAPPAGAMKNRGPHADRFAANLAIITSVLEPAQRELLAARIEAGPGAHFGKRMPGAKLPGDMNAH